MNALNKYIALMWASRDFCILGVVILFLGILNIDVVNFLYNFFTGVAHPWTVMQYAIVSAIPTALSVICERLAHRVMPDMPQ